MGDKIPKITDSRTNPISKSPGSNEKGYAQAEIGDSINLERPSSQYRRGRVGKGIANTLTTSGQMGVVVASYEGEDKQVYHVAGVLIDGQFYRFENTTNHFLKSVFACRAFLIGLLKLLEKSLVIVSSINKLVIV